MSAVFEASMSHSPAIVSRSRPAGTPASARKRDTHRKEGLA